MNFFKNFLITSSTSITITVLAFLNNIIVTRHLGPDGRGIYAVVTNLIMLLVLIFGEGIRRSNTVIIGKHSDQTRLLFRQTILHSIIICIIFVLIYLLKFTYLILLPNITSTLIILGLCISVFSILWQSVQALLLGLQKIVGFNIILIVQIGIFFLINIIGIWFLNFQVEQFFLSMLISAAITFIIGIGLLKPNSPGTTSTNKKIAKESYLVGFKSTISALAMFLNFRGNIFLINFFLNPFQAGIYAVAAFFFEFMLKIPNFLGPLVISATVQDFSLKPAHNSARLIRTIFLFNLFIVVCLFFGGKFILVILFGNDFLESYTPLVYLLPALLFIGPGGIIHAYFMGRAYPIQLVWITIITGIMNIVLNIIYIPKFGILAAAAVTSISLFLWFLSLLILFYRESKISYKEILLFNKSDLVYLIDSFSRVKSKII